MRTLAERLKDWTDWDVAEYHLGVVLGLFPEWPGSWDNDVTAPLKGVIWSQSLIGDALAEGIRALSDSGLMYHNEDAGRYRWMTERERNWENFYLSIKYGDSSVDAFTGEQAAVFDEVWQRLTEAEPNIMYPTVTHDTEQAAAVALSWNPQGLTLDIEIDANGGIEWFFADHVGTSVTVEGTDHSYVEYAPRFARVE